MRNSRFLILMIMLISIMMLNSFVYAGSEYWSKASDWAKEDLLQAGEYKLVPDLLKNKDLTTNITRREFAHIAWMLFDKINQKVNGFGGINPFEDTDDEIIVIVYHLGITNGTSETTFSPDSLITREQMATMMTRAIEKAGYDVSIDLAEIEKFTDDNEMHSWGRNAIYYLSDLEIIKGIGNGKYGVTGTATKEQALLIANRILNAPLYEEYAGSIFYNPYVDLNEIMEVTFPNEFTEGLFHGNSTYHLEYYSKDDTMFYDSSLRMDFILDNYRSPKQMLNSMGKYYFEKYSWVEVEPVTKETINQIEWYKLVVKNGSYQKICLSTAIEDEIFLIDYEIKSEAEDTQKCLQLLNQVVQSIRLKG